MRRLIFIIGVILLSSCGYKLNPLISANKVRTLSIPYVEGDIDGQLTATLIGEISTSGAYHYQDEGAEWILKARILDNTYENIGFRYDRSRKGRLKHWLIPVERRKGVLIEVELLSACALQVVQGPCQLYASIEYDHDYYTIRDGVNVFSLCQLTDIDSAEDAAKIPLYQKLAEKVVSWLTYH